MADIEKLIGSESPLEVGQKINEIIENGVGGGSGFNLFDTKISDHILEAEEALGWALQGTYVNGAVYPDFYNKCISEKEKSVATEITLGDYVFTMYIASNGHQYYDIADKTVVDTWFNTYGSAWFYGIDTENERIFLPRDKYFAVNGVAPVVGNGITLGLTDGTQNYGIDQHITGAGDSCIDVYVNNYGKFVGETRDIGGTTSTNKILGVTPDPTNSGIEAHLTTNEDKYLYICVGNTTVNEGLIDVSQVLSQAVLRSSLVEVQTVIETYVNGASWYRIWSDGFCEQSGKTDKGTKIAITLLKPYKDTNYQIMVGQYHTGATDMHGTVVRDSKTVNGFTIAGNANVDFNWEVKGYIW